jgi:hypothetical protein
VGGVCDELFTAAAAVAPWAGFFTRLPAFELQLRGAVGEAVLVAAGAEQLVPSVAACLGCNVQACDTHGGGVWNEVKRCEDGRTVQPWRADA